MDAGADVIPSGWRSARRRLGDVTLHVIEAGPEDGPLVILLHGFPDLWWTWRHQIGALAGRGFRVLAPELRGYGLSSKPEGLRAYALPPLVRDVLGLAEGRDRFHLVGHDWGGIIAWETAIRHPGRIHRLVIMDAPHPDVLGPTIRRHPGQALRSAYVAFFQLPLLPEALLRARGFALMRRALRKSSRKAIFSDAVLDRYCAGWRQPGALTAMLNYYRALRHKPSEAPRSVQPPALVIWGGLDSALSRPVFEASLEPCREVRSLFLPQASHWVHLEEPEAVTGALLDFLGQG